MWELHALNSPACLWRDQGKFAARVLLLVPGCGQALAPPGQYAARLATSGRTSRDELLTDKYTPRLLQPESVRTLPTLVRCEPEVCR